MKKNEISVIKCRDDIWFKAKQVATLLGSLDPGRSIRRNVGAKSASPLVSNFQGSTLYLNESGLYSLIFGSKL